MPQETQQTDISRVLPLVLSPTRIITTYKVNVQIQYVCVFLVTIRKAATAVAESVLPAESVQPTEPTEPVDLTEPTRIVTESAKPSPPPTLATSPEHVVLSLYMYLDILKVIATKLLTNKTFSKIYAKLNQLYSNI